MGVQEYAPKDEALPTAEEQMDISNLRDKVIPHQKLKIEEDRDKQGKPLEEKEYRSGQPDGVCLHSKLIS